MVSPANLDHGIEFARVRAGGVDGVIVAGDCRNVLPALNVVKWKVRRLGKTCGQSLAYVAQAWEALEIP